MKWWMVVAVVVLCASAARGDVLLHRQAPGRTFGITSDTAWLNDGGTPTSSLIADKFSLASDAEICRVSAYGFFGGTGVVDPGPPAVETLRVRFYDDSSGLPDSVDYELTIPDPSRTFTGQFINISGARQEYLYQLPLSHCFAAQGGENYWLEIAQIGDVNSRFRWENSNTAGEYAVQFPISSPWHVTTGSGQMAYELWTPEPGSGVLVGLVGLMLRRRGKWA